MAKKLNKEELDEAVQLYADYFTDINDKYNTLLNQTENYLNIAGSKINELNDLPMGTRGAQHYLTEHLDKAASLISQCQSLNDSRYKIKKTIIDYAVRDLAGSDDGISEDYTAAIAKLVKQEKEKLEKHDEDIQTILNETNLDDEIDRILESKE